METPKVFDGTPCIVEMMGHVRYTCLVTETNIAGAGMLRLDWDGAEPWTKLINFSSLYCITPIAPEMYDRYKEVAKKQEPFNFYMPSYVLKGNPHPEPGLLDEGGEDDEEKEDYDEDRGDLHRYDERAGSRYIH